MYATAQSDPSWIVERRGLLTASRMADAMAYLKNGKEAEARRKYKIELLAERVADYAVNHYVTPAMERGIQLEPEARMAYETETGLLTTEALLIHHPRIEFFAGTPDGLIGHDGMVEFKCPLVNTYMEWYIAGAIPEQHMPQLLAQLSVTQRRWVDFCAFCPEMPEGKQLLRKRLYADPESIANIEAAAKAFLDELEVMFRAFTENVAA